MDLITETYLGWTPYPHTGGCPAAPGFEVETRRTEGIRPQSTGPDHHTCPHPVCEHGDLFRRVQVRLLCRTCSTVYILGGEALTEVLTHTALTGWGQAPARHGDVWLWPGRPAAPGHAPHDYLATRTPDPVTEATLYGIITAVHDAAGIRRWLAGAEPTPTGAHQIGALRWRYASPALPSVGEAAAWLTATATAPQRTVVVTV
ncbi:hypothetical protein [Streptomyces sp. SHP 1-2]|uniref:hypothetical protein n=1 Tax=Streptomyces sp. SHP 1-2 TaxID=2769489 RepID=UPI002238CFB9|nr:hypothetical protein [Streptomyces sp. SHP 1-2]MCW5252241.1 hypothetical protein [Streptomyces sp. SHP 1-2]